MAQKYIIGDLIKYKVGGLEFIAEITNTSKYGYWRGDLSDYLKNRNNFEYFMRGYENDAYRHIMEWLDKKK